MTKEQKIALAVATGTSFATAFSGSATNLAIPAMGTYFHMGAASVGWITTAYVIVNPFLFKDFPSGAAEILTFPVGLLIAFFSEDEEIISLVIAMKASETFFDSLAEVSKNCMPYCAAKSFPCSKVTFLSFTKSHLFPTKILCTDLDAFFSISINHEFKFWNDSMSVISYTTIIPCAPL